ncbi:hypothetical protein BZG34_02525 [Neisseria gonorrhoeae]|nr:hypothetical protein BZG33_04445 [Neisseria gonorrhoeae]ASQ73061.1 hypothetical protein BZG34_02525 [Neisseria gonorrhoeae]OHZ60279.1 hypothetical protein BBZ63_09135 [Neisseria gonorrhoeae]OIA45584.1 hypothetical protein BB016_07185 [Neisseria gonorrhoeae]PAX27210.1 hypothetical protein CKX32_01925 [Neisseria gonorrhoeae]
MVFKHFSVHFQIAGQLADVLEIAAESVVVPVQIGRCCRNFKITCAFRFLALSAGFLTALCQQQRRFSEAAFLFHHGILCLPADGARSVTQVFNCLYDFLMVVGIFRADVGKQQPLYVVIAAAG